MTEDPAGRSDPQPRARLAAVVLNYRTPDLVVRCLESLVPQLDPQRDLVIVVDNASGDRSGQKLDRAIAERGWSRVRLLERSRNDGFAAGNNAGVSAVRAEEYLLLNSDVELRSGAVDALHRRLSDERAGLVSPRLEWPDGTPQKSCFRAHSPLGELIEASGTGLVARALARWNVPLPVSDEIVEPTWTSFACVLIRAAVFEQVGPLDERFFLYYEDTDYCRRARAGGWRILHDPSARAVHLRGRSSPVKALAAKRLRRPAYYYRSRRLYFRNAYGPAGPLAANLCWSVGRALAWLREVVGHKRPHAVERELFDVWFN